ncbi:serine/threonine-protein kinase ATM [Striga asiatica]|uniref:Serine/threonine-protein kinase ATM n=1 Tax=Striga asiatica TaxID=4170 RepID=A0A5A7RI28_STRAF|nr:serine/threonine-protein kinase ATM [Striga asiatica]
MASKVASRDIQDIISKLSSDKAKIRDEGMKLLNTWLEGERSIGFCRYLSEKSSTIKPNEIPHSETWPFLVKTLIQCVSLEISSSKKRLPKLNFAKTLRIVVQRAEDDRFFEKSMFLLPVARVLFNHVWDVLKDVPSFQSEYGVILRHLLAAADYRFHIRKRVYSNLVLLFMEKVEVSLSTENISQLNPKEEVFRYTLTLQSLLENPPGDIPDELRDDIIKGFIGIFSQVRDEGKVSRKLVECINTYLSKDGTNLGCKSLEIHDAVHKFVFRCWFATHDRSLKDTFICYAKLQLSVTRGVIDGTAILEQFLDVVSKELDQMSVFSTNIPSNIASRSDSSRDEKCGVLTSSQNSVVELAALVFCRVCTSKSKTLSGDKRARQEHTVVQIKERLVEGKWSWHAAFCCLIRKYSTRVKRDLFIYWFENISAVFERIANNVNLENSYDGLLWTLRSLQSFLADIISDLALLMIPQVEKGWRIIWSCLIRCFPTFINVTPIVSIVLEILTGSVNPSLGGCCYDAPLQYHVECKIIITGDLSFFPCDEFSFAKQSVLCFASCYFSRRASQGDHRDAFYLRQNILRAVLALLNLKECSSLNERLVVALPVAAYALCSGSACPINEPLGLAQLLHVSESTSERVKEEEQSLEKLHDFFECSVEVLARISDDSEQKGTLSEYPHIRLPRQLKDRLLQEMENYVLECIRDKENEKFLLPELINICALLSNFMYCSYSSRIREDISPFFFKLGEAMLELLDHAISVIEKTCNDSISGCWGLNSLFNNAELTVASFKSFISSPLLSKWPEKNSTSRGLYPRIIQSAEKLLKGLAKLYEGCSGHRMNIHANITSPDLPSVLDSVPLGRSKSLILDMELDINGGSMHVDSLAVDGDGDHTSGASISFVNQKMDLLLIMSSFFSILPSLTWEILFNLKEKESNPKVSEKFLLILCQHPHWSSCKQLLDLITSMADIIHTWENLKLQSSYVLCGICNLVGSLLHLDGAGKHETVAYSSGEKLFDECLISLGDLVNKVFENSFLDWRDRSKLVDCICSFISLRPQIAQQSMIEKLFMLLRDPDYRVRFCLARRIGVLFQTWDGHLELFQDVYSLKNLSISYILAFHIYGGVCMMCSIYYQNLFLNGYSFQAVFMVCVIAAIDPRQRQLVCAVLDSLSTELQYTNRTKYLEELMGQILFCWVACGVSLVALVETRDLYVLNVEPVNFIQYCCQWLLPALMLQEDTSNILWVSKVAHQSCADLIKYHFVHIFSICMALHCNNKVESDKGYREKAECDKGSRVLGSYILQIAEISEHERDELIKKRMVSIVNQTLSLASSLADPPLPFFSKDTIEIAIRIVVDGFLDSEDQSRNSNLVDKINIFRPDRVFMFILDMHYKVTAAAHHWHKCKHLAGVEVLVNLLGSRAAIPSTSNYLLNLTGHFVDCHYLTDQCCCIISILLRVSRDSPSVETTRVLGEQLQFLVSKLVAHCAPSASCDKLSAKASSQPLLLLQQLTVGSDSSLYEYIKELEPFPEFNIFDDIRMFHEKICETYSPRAHLLNFVKRSQHVPPRFLLYSLKALHKNISTKGRHLRKELDEDENFLKDAYWHSDNEIAHAPWSLVSICSLDDTNDLGAMVSDFISRVGIGDPHRVVFHIPGESNGHVSGLANAVKAADPNICTDTAMCSEVLLVLMRLLKKYLMDDSVEMIDLASQALRGILSTEKGQQSLLNLDSYERSLMEVHSKGVNLELVQSLIASLQRKYDAKSVSIEDSAVWSTGDKTFEAWICPLVCAMISYCDDLILRLCQDIVLVKSEVAELLFPEVIVNIAGRKGSNIDICKVISLKVQEHVFIESNALKKSVQVFLLSLNELRQCHVMERTKSPASLNKPKISKHTKQPSSVLRSRSVTSKGKDLETASLGLGISTSLWEKFLRNTLLDNFMFGIENELPIAIDQRVKLVAFVQVYWLAVDYLVVAKSAIDCGSYFTAFLYVEHWCEEHFNGLTLGSPDFSHHETLPPHVDILLSAVTQINEPDSLYGIIQSHKLTSQIITFEHEGNWSKALEYYDMQVRSQPVAQISSFIDSSTGNYLQTEHAPVSETEHGINQKKPYKGLIRSLQQVGCTHVLDVYCQGLTSQRGRFQHDLEFSELQYEAAWRAGNWDFCPLYSGADTSVSYQCNDGHNFNENLHSCLRALQEGEFDEFHTTLKDSKQALLMSICHASKESTEHIYSSIVKLQIFYHLGMAWDFRWCSLMENFDSSSGRQKLLLEPVIPTIDQLQWLHRNWSCILKQTDLHMNLLEPFIAFRRVLLQVLNSMDSKVHHLREAASVLRKGSRISQAAAALHEFKSLCSQMGEEYSNLYWLGRSFRNYSFHKLSFNSVLGVGNDTTILYHSFCSYALLLEEAKLLRAQGQHEMAINLADYISQNQQLKEEAPDVFRLVGKWLAETRSSNSRTILEKYLKQAVNLAEDNNTNKLSKEKRNQMHFHLAHYSDALFRSHEERLYSNEWKVALQLRELKEKEREALTKRYKSAGKEEKIDLTLKIQELQKQLAMDTEEEKKLQVSSRMIMILTFKVAFVSG